MATYAIISLGGKQYRVQEGERLLVDRCLEFARSAGYGRIVLWTNDVLVDARRLYEHAGFELLEEASHHAFGHDLVEPTWGREL